jgi:hypothetical protein
MKQPIHPKSGRRKKRVMGGAKKEKARKHKTNQEKQTKKQMASIYV